MNIIKLKETACILFFILFIVVCGYGQFVPKGMNYQAVARDLNGQIMSGKGIGLKIYLFSRQDQSRVNHYTEFHEVFTDSMGCLLYTSIVTMFLHPKAIHMKLPVVMMNLQLKTIPPMALVGILKEIRTMQ